VPCSVTSAVVPRSQIAIDFRIAWARVKRPVEGLIDANDVANWLSLPRRKVIAMARDGTLPCYALPCGEFIFDEKEVADWLRKQKREAVPR
jgi:hypothetical protein